MDKNTFAPTPPRGWNSYDYYDTAVTEADVRKNADFMAKHLKSAGYEYVVVDIQWYATDAGTRRNEYQYIPFGGRVMDEYGRFWPDPARFPSSTGGRGFGPLAEYIHSLGLKFGIHIMRGLPRDAAHRHLPVYGADITCDEIADPLSVCDWDPDMYGLRDRPESQAYYDSVVSLYAAWGVDFLKVDDICNTHAFKDRPYMGRHEVEMLARAIDKAGRPMVLSLSPGPALLDMAWHYCRYANMWRITDDFWDSWPALKHMFDFCERWQYVGGPGCWPDCDMLPLGTVGRGFGQERLTNFTRDEQAAMMTLWCLFRSPLMLGAELTKLDPETLALITNPALLALQSPTAVPRQLSRDETCAVWQSTDGEALTLALFNLSDTPLTLSPTPFLPPSYPPSTPLMTPLQDLLTNAPSTTPTPAHGVRLYKIR